MTTKLKLGPLPRTEVVKITLSMSVELRAMLDRYAQLHAEASGEKNTSLGLFPTCWRHSCRAIARSFELRVLTAP